MNCHSYRLKALATGNVYSNKDTGRETNISTYHVITHEIEKDQEKSKRLPTSESNDCSLHHGNHIRSLKTHKRRMRRKCSRPLMQYSRGKVFRQIILTKTKTYTDMQRYWGTYFQRLETFIRKIKDTGHKCCSFVLYCCPLQALLIISLSPQYETKEF